MRPFGGNSPFSILNYQLSIDFVETASLVLCVNKFSPTRLLAVFSILHSQFSIINYQFSIVRDVSKKTSFYNEENDALDCSSLMAVASALART